MNNIELKLTANIQIMPSGKMGIYSVTFDNHYDEIDEDERVINSYISPEARFYTSSDMMLVVNDLTNPKELRDYLHNWIMSNPSDENYINKMSLLGFNENT